MSDKIIGIVMLAVFLIGLAGLRRIWRADWQRKITSLIALVLCLLIGLGCLLHPSLVRDWTWVVLLVWFSVYLIGGISRNLSA